MNSILLVVVSLSVSGSLPALLLLALRPLLAGRVSARWQYYIWLVVVLRLLLPFGLPNSPVDRLFARVQPAAPPAAADGLPANPESPTPDLWVADDGPAEATTLPAELTVQPTEAAVTGGDGVPETRPVWRALLDSLWLLWLVGAFTLLVRKVTGYHAFLGYIRAGCRPVEEGPVTDAYRALCAEMKVRRPPVLRRNPLAAAPMLVGVLRPFIVLPELEDEAENAANILRHELIHHRRGDLYYKWLAQLAACVHWFNPLVYRVLGTMGRDCELSCDEAVVRSMGEEEKFLYGETLLTTIKPDPGYSNAIVSVTLNEDTKRLKERLEAIMRSHMKSRTTALASALLAAVLVIGGAWTGVYAAPGSRRQESKESSPILTPAAQIDVADRAAPEPTAVVSGDEEVREYLKGSASWQAFLATGSVSSNLWPQSIAVQYHNETAYPITTHFFNEKTVEALLTVRHESGGLGVVIRNEAGDIAFSQANIGSGQHAVRLPATDSKYSLEVYMDGFSGAVLLEAVSVVDVEPAPPPESDSSIVVERLPSETSPPNVNERPPYGENVVSSDDLAYFAIPYYLDQFPDIWTHTSGSAISGNWPRYLMAQSVNGGTDEVATDFLVDGPIHVVITAHTTGGSFGMRIIGPNNEVIFDQQQISSARYRVYFHQSGRYSIEYSLDGYYGRMLLENEVHTDVFHGVDLGFVYGYGEVSETVWNEGLPPEQNQANKSTAVDAAAYHVMSYSGSWDVVDWMLPFMTWDGIDAVIDLYNQKNPNANLLSWQYHGFYTPDREDSDARAWEITVLTGANWVYIEPLFPYMTNAGIERVINRHNQLTGKRLNPADYYN